MRRILAIVGAVVALSALPVAATELPPSDEPGHSQRSPEADLIEFLRERFGFSEDGARERLEIERAAGRLNQAVDGLWPETFAGMWLNTTGAFTTVTAAFTADLPARLDDLRSRFEFPDHLEVIEVTTTLAQLEALQQRVVRDRTALQEGRPVDVPPSLARTGGQFDVSVDVRRNQVYIVLHEPDPLMLDEVRGHYGTDALNVTIGAMTPSCSRENCAYTMKGGLHLRFGTQPGCTSAFSVTGGSGNHYVLSAGHCNGGLDAGSPRNNGGVLYGNVHRDVMQGNVDAERILRTGSWSNAAEVYLSGSSSMAITGYLPYLTLLPGITVQASLRSGSNPVTLIASNNFSPGYIPGGTQFLTTLTGFGAGGDSGAPFFVGVLGAGIYSGGTNISPCGVLLQGCISFGALEFALNELNVSLL